MLKSGATFNPSLAAKKINLINDGESALIKSLRLPRAYRGRESSCQRRRPPQQEVEILTLAISDRRRGAALTPRMYPSRKRQTLVACLDAPKWNARQNMILPPQNSPPQREQPTSRRARMRLWL
jgi:hypothetical protein